MAERTRHKIFVVSDGTGTTAERVIRAALLQFPEADPVIERRPEVRLPQQVRAVVQEAREHGAMIVHTLVSPELRRFLYMEADSAQVIAVDLMGTVLTQLARYLQTAPQVRPGILYGDERYFRRVEALEYAIHHDDGQGLRDIDRAEIVLVGVSRTSKTPVSVYLAYRGFRVANVPIVLGMPLPDAIGRVPPGRVVGLVVEAERLAAIREARLRHYPLLGLEYADIDHIRRELRHSREIFAAHGWPVVDVTGRSVEETAREVLNLVGLSE
ncbi:MAG: pyruvate, water dikinase regulatory protein [Chloroflexia bacterium]